MDYSTGIRRTYWGAVPHTLFTALIWIGAGILGDLTSPNASILAFLIGGTFTFPGGELIRRAFPPSPPLDPGNTLTQMFMWLAFTIPASYPLIYLAIKSDTGLFYPAFALLVGAHYLPFVYGYGMPSFLILAGLLVTQGAAFAFAIPHSFSLPAYTTGGTLLIFAAIHYYIIKKELWTLQPNN